MSNPKFTEFTCIILPRDVQRVDVCCWRSTFTEPYDFINILLLPFEEGFYSAVWEIADPACHFMLNCYVPRFNSEEDALYSTANVHVSSDLQRLTLGIVILHTPKYLTMKTNNAITIKGSWPDCEQWLWN